MLEPLHTDNSPFTEPQLRELKKGIDTLDHAQTMWLSGYLAGRMIVAGDLPVSSGAVVDSQSELNILYGSDTGNGQAIASQLADSAGAAGLAVKLQSMADVRPVALKKMQQAVFVISTHGDGDPPDDALDVFEYLGDLGGDALKGLQYRVLALGDRSYNEFCAAGRTLDGHLERLGASPFGACIECDLDYTEEAAQWSEQVLTWARENLEQHESAIPAARLSLVSSATTWSKQNPFNATLTRKQKITGQGSDKDVHHVELSLAGSGIEYLPGDSLAVRADNDDALVSEILNNLSLDPGTQLDLDGNQQSISEVLRKQREITRLSADTIQKYAEAASVPELADHFANLQQHEQKTFIEQRQFADLVSAWPGQISAADLAGILRPLNSRAYSIASSQALVEDEVHLTVATLSSNAIGTDRHGVASHGLNHRFQSGGEIEVFLEPNPRFRLPADPSTPIIMIAAGTGIAPYRAFMQQLEHDGNSPDSWLLFGNPHMRSDFLYQKEWLAFRKQGLVNRIDVAFSRDQAEKRYVQHALLEQGKQLEEWLQRGAHIYVCGSLAMGHAVELAMQQILADQRGLEPDAARQTLRDLRREGRLLKDLY